MEENKNEITIDDLAQMVQGGFNDVNERFDGVDKRLDRLERGQEEIKLELVNTPYRFGLTDLQRRVEVLEGRAGFTR